jgi:predicted Fe-Mo cluster-binding NifX family protein
MKIAISSQSQDLQGAVDPRFGRTAGFIIYDLDTDTFEYLQNAQNLSLAQGAGIQTAQNVAKAGVTGVITGHVGPKAYLALNKGKIDMYLLPGDMAGATVEQAIEAFRQGKLEKAGGPDRDGHW